MSNSARAYARQRGAIAALASTLLVSTSLLVSTGAFAAPPIRTNGANKVPACVSPSRLMAFLRERNGDLDPRYDGIAKLYKQYGEAWSVRWDYAFYQMVLETNYLKYRRGNGRRGDVHEKQNNFAGIGATGGGVAGERFADIKTGVHAQIQHLVAYSGERVATPVAKRTDENQDDIIAKSRRLGRPVTFGDLARRWAADRRYAQSIDTVAGLFNDGHCRGPALAEDETDSPQAKVRYADASGLGGPKPLKLAGPETLPWEGDGGDAGSGSAHQRASEPETPRTADGPVRTLWSRGKGSAGAPAKDNPAKDKAGKDAVKSAPEPAPQEDAADAAPAVERSVSTAARPDQARPAGTMSPEPAATAETATDNLEPVQLPTFRIAPARSEPSRLGGPVEPAPAATATRAALPQGTFVEMDDALSTSGAASGPAPAPRALRPAGMATTGAVKTAAMTAPTGAASAAEPAPAQADCRVLTASYGGKRTLLVQSEKNGVLLLTALTVLDGFEDSMVASYAKASAPGAKVVAAFDSKDKALAHAREICTTN